MYGPIYQRLLILLFIAALWSPLLATLPGSTVSVSTAEKRKLAEFPRWEASWKAFVEGLEDYYNDHFGFRQSLIRWYNIVLVKWLGESNTRWVLVGRDDWLFQGGDPHLRDILNAWPFSDAELARWAQVMSSKHQWLKAQGITYVFAITPSKHLVYPDKLPRSFRRATDTSRMDQLVDYLRKNTQVPVLDLRPPLRAARATLRPYHLTDTHWNAFGAYVGYREILQAAGVAPAYRGVPDMRPADFRATMVPGGDLAQALDLRDVLTESVLMPEVWRPDCAEYSKVDADALVRYLERFDDQFKHRQSFTTRCPRATGRLLMFRDSFALALMPYLSETFGYIHYVPHSPVSLKNLQPLVIEHRPDVVIEQRTSRWLRTPHG